MDCEHLLPFVERKLLDRLDDLNAGIANQNVHPAVAFDGSSNAGLDGRLVAHVHRDAHGDAPRAIDFIRGRLRRRQLQVGDDDFCALASETLGNFLANAARGAGYDGDFSLELSHESNPSWSE